MFHHFAHRLPSGIIEILVEANRNEMRGTFREWPFDFHILADGKTKSARNACLESGDADFSVALNAVSVACEEQGAFVKNRQVERGAGTQFLVVHVASECARHRRTASAPVGRRSGSDDAEEGIERSFGAPWHRADIARAIDDWMNSLVVGEFFRERSEQRKNRNEAPILANPHIENFDLERVAGLSAFEVNWPGDEMWAWPRRQRLDRL
jgi:hypothetical protein